MSLTFKPFADAELVLSGTEQTRLLSGVLMALKRLVVAPAGLRARDVRRRGQAKLLTVETQKPLVFA